MAVARSPIDTILGEAVSGTPEDRYNDMLHIASVIANRAREKQISIDDVVSQPGQFDAYGKSLPAGAEAYRALAEQAMRQVMSQGPVTRATFYSTPATQKNLPRGLEAVAKTTGHIYNAVKETAANVRQTVGD